MTLALLTPVPLIHLEDGLRICAREGRVAFGSQAWEVFRKFDEEAGAGAPVLIYASHAGSVGAPAVSWTGVYVCYRESRGGAHPEGTRIRPMWDCCTIW